MSISQDLMIRIKTLAELGGFNQTIDSMRKAESAGKNMGNTSTASMGQLSSSTQSAAQKVQQLANSSDAAQAGIRRIGTSGAAVDRIGASANASGKNLDKMGQAGRAAGNNTASGMKNAENAANSLNTAIGGVIAGFGLMQIGQAAASGAMSKEMNAALLERKYGMGQAQTITSQIQQIVADVPGDDTYMNQMLNLASYKTGLTDMNKLKELGITMADYTIGGQVVAGQRPWESQMELKDYILNGNTGLMARDGILRNHIDKLEKAKTIEERMQALNEAMNEEGIKGISTLETTSTTWENVKGKIQLALTTLGEKFLPTASDVLDKFLDLDEKTGGFSSELVVAGGAAVALAGSVGLIASPLKNAFDLAKDLAKTIANFVLPSTKTVKIICEKDPNCTTTGPTTTTTGGKGSSGSKTGLLPLLSKVGAWATGGLAAGDILGNYVVGPFMDAVSAPISNILGTGGQQPFKAYHGILDMLGLGNTDYQVLNYEQQVRKANEGKILPSGQGPLNFKFPELPKGIINPFPQLPSGQDLLNLFPKPGKGISGWGGLTGGLGDLLKGGPNAGGILDWLLPKPAAAGFWSGNPNDPNNIAPSHPSFQEDLKSIFGDWKLPDIGLNDILGIITPKIPFLDWKPPSVPDLVNSAEKFIHDLNWNVPGVPDLVASAEKFIGDLNWNVPGIPDVLGQIFNRIDPLHWSIPSSGDILNAIVGRISLTGSVSGLSNAVNTVNSTPTIGTNFAEKYFGGDEISMRENALGVPLSSYRPQSTSTKTTIAPVIKIESIDSKETADYFAQKVADELSDINDTKGR